VEKQRTAALQLVTTSLSVCNTTAPSGAGLPPQFSRANSGFRVCDMNGEMRFKSYVLTRVASSDWCASRNVVSISSSCLCCRTALASPSGPFSSSTSRQPRGVASRASRPTQSQSTVTNKQTHHDRHTYKLKLTTHSEVHNFFSINYTCCSHDVLLTDANNLAISPSLFL